MKKTEYDALTNETIETEMSKDELAQLKKDQAADASAKALVQAELEAKAIAKAELLSRLGITADEAKLLLG